MIAPQLQSELDSATSIFEQIAIDSGEQVEKSAIRRAMEEAIEAFPGSAEERWWKWVIEAAESLGLKAKVVDCTFEQAVSVVQGGAHIVTRIRSSSSWIAATSGPGKKLVSYQTEDNREVMSIKKYRQQFDTDDSQLRMVILKPKPPSVASTKANPIRKPLDRLWKLLTPESSDVWIIVVFALVNGVLMMATPLAIESLVTTVAFGSLLQPVFILSGILFGFLAFSAVLRALQTVVVEIIQRRLFARVVADLAYRLPRVKYEALDGKYAPELVNRFFDVVTVQKVSAQLLLDGISLVLGTIIGMAVLAFYHPWLLGFDVVLLALIAFVVFVLGRGAVASSIKESKTKYYTAAFLEDIASSLTTFKIGGASDFVMERADHLTYDYIEARRKHFRILMRQIIFALGMQAIASTALLGLGGWLVISGELTLGQLVAAELIVTIIVGSFAKLGKHMESFYDLLASVDKLGALFDLPIETTEGILTPSNGKPAETVFKGLAYSSPSGLSVMDTVDCTVSAGAVCFINGPSGSGKSSLIDIIYGFRTATQGHLTIDGIDTRDMRPNVLRRHVNLLRHNEIFDGTIAENVHLERPEISKNDVTDALEAVGLLDDILELPDGLNTHLTSSGFPMSRTQACQLMVARSIVSSPNVLLIDGLLDPLSDTLASELMQTLTGPDRPWTIFLITSRESLKQFATTSIELAKTRVIARRKTEGTDAHA